MCVTFLDWHFSLSIMFVKPVQVFADVDSSFIFYYCLVFQGVDSLFNHEPVKGLYGGLLF